MEREKNSSNKPPCFLVFSDDWGEHPSSCQHIFKHIAKSYKVIWVNTIGMRNPKLCFGDLKKIYYKVKKMLFPHNKPGTTQQETPPLLTVCQPLMLPYANIPFIRKLNKILVVRKVKKSLSARGMEHPYCVATVPNACDYMGMFGEKRKVYYCVDDFTLWPGFEHKLVCAMENKLIKKCTTFIATSTKLYDKLKKESKPTMLLTHGVDVEHFANLPDKEHNLLRDIPKPRIGYFGLIDERFDQKLLADTAKNLPKISFVITGDIVTDVTMLKKFTNIHFTGKISYDELPAMVKGWDVCMLPYRINVLSQSINPLKLKEYMATGKQVIATPLPEALALTHYIKVATAPEWSALLEAIIIENREDHSTKQEDDGRVFIKNEDWSTKALQFLENTYPEN